MLKFNILKAAFCLSPCLHRHLFTPFTVFNDAEGYLLGTQRPLFALQKITFYTPKGRLWQGLKTQPGGILNKGTGPFSVKMS